MTDIKGHPSSSSFVCELRKALHHLYDWIVLGQSPLVELFDVGRRENSSSALRGILTEAIESLKPGADVPSRAKAWRTYQVLYSRYVEQFTQKETATELGLSIRHLRREESSALQALATYLWHHHNLELKWPGQDRPLPAEEKIASAGTQTPTQEQELEWLQSSLPRELVDVQELIQAVLKLAGSLAQASRVRLDCSIPDSAPYLVVQLTTLRQALLTILTAIIRSVPGGQVLIKVQVQHSQMHIYVQPKGERIVSSLDGETAERLEMAQRLVELSGGSLEIVPGEGERAIKIVLPAKEQVPVLVIDDNVDTLRLLERYLSNSRYRFFGTSDPQQAVQLAKDASPRMIVLDVMLPGIDGWELLGRLHEHPQTCDIPIIVCTILPQEQLAANLGAADFVRKPVNRKAFLSALDRQFALGREPTRSKERR